MCLPRLFYNILHVLILYGTLSAMVRIKMFIQSSLPLLSSLSVSLHVCISLPLSLLVAVLLVALLIVVVLVVVTVS